MLAAAALSALVGCGSSDNEPAGGDSSSASGGGGGSSSDQDPGQPSSRTLWTITSFLPSLRGLDTGTHEVVLDVDVAELEESSTEVNALSISDDLVWVGRDDGVLAVVDRRAQELAAKIDLAPFGESETVSVNHIALGGGYAFSSPEYNIQPPILKIDASSFEVVQQADILDGVGYPTGILHDGADLWLMQWNAIELVRADPATLEVRARVALGQDPDHPNDFGPFYGYGYLADSGDTLWVIDTTSVRLLSVDKETLTPRIVADLGELTTFETYLEFDANSRGVFLLLEDQGIVVRFDPESGERLNTYDFSDDGGVGTMAVGPDSLYVTPSGTLVYDTREIDIDTGRVLQTITSDVAISNIAVQK